MNWASFHIVEVMSSPKIHLKSVGYLGAVQSFNEDTDVLMLTTNLLKKVRDSLTFSVKSTIQFHVGSKFNACRRCGHSKWRFFYHDR